MRPNQRAANTLNRVYRNFMHKYNPDFRKLLIMAYNDAMTFNPKTKKGKEALKHLFIEERNADILTTKISLQDVNKAQLEMENSKIFKTLEAPVQMDFLTFADFIQFGAIEAILMNDGPMIGKDFRYGRYDMSLEPEVQEEDTEIASQNIPKPESSSFFSDFEEKGFTKEETVALGALLAYDVVKPKHSYQWRNHAKFDNYYFKNLVTRESHNPELPQDKHYLENAEEVIKEFAEDRAKFNEAYRKAHLKMSELGHQMTELNAIGDIVEMKVRFYEDDK